MLGCLKYLQVYHGIVAIAVPKRQEEHKYLQVYLGIVAIAVNTRQEEHKYLVVLEVGGVLGAAWQAHVLHLEQLLLILGRGVDKGG